MAKPGQQGDMVEAVRQLRRLVTALDSSAFALRFDFAALGGEVEEKMQRVRAPQDLLTARLVESLEAIEGSSQYRRATERTTK